MIRAVSIQSLFCKKWVKIFIKIDLYSLIEITLNYIIDVSISIVNLYKNSYTHP